MLLDNKKLLLKVKSQLVCKFPR